MTHAHQQAEAATIDFARGLYEQNVHKSAEGVPLWYLATPYRVPKAIAARLPKSRCEDIAAARFEAAARVAANLMNVGYRIFCPIAHTVPMEPYLGHWEASAWLIADEPFITRCTGLIIGCLPGWEASGGVEYERQRFAEQNKIIKHVNPRSLFTASEWHRLELTHDKENEPETPAL